MLTKRLICFVSLCSALMLGCTDDGIEHAIPSQTPDDGSVDENGKDGADSGKKDNDADDEDTKDEEPGDDSDTNDSIPARKFLRLKMMVQMRAASQILESHVTKSVKSERINVSVAGVRFVS